MSDETNLDGGAKAVVKKPKTAKPKTAKSKSDLMRERADDMTSLYHFHGPRAGRNVAAMLRELADLEDGKLRVHKPPTPNKRPRV